MSSSTQTDNCSIYFLIYIQHQFIILHRETVKMYVHGFGHIFTSIRYCTNIQNSVRFFVITVCMKSTLGSYLFSQYIEDNKCIFSL